jgi:hypothetical protein
MLGREKEIGRGSKPGETTDGGLERWSNEIPRYIWWGYLRFGRSPQKLGRRWKTAAASDVEPKWAEWNDELRT